MATKKIKDWELNVKARGEFVRDWIDTQNLRIAATNGVVDVSGKLVFKGGKVDTNSDLAISKQLKSTERAIRSILGVRDVKLKFKGWEKVGGLWQRSHKKDVD